MTATHGPNSASAAPFTGIWHGASRHEAERLALVLLAAGIAVRIDPAAGGWVLLVPTAEVTRADAELRAALAEELATKPPAHRPQPAGDTALALLAITAILFFLDAAAKQRLFGLDWWEAGAADAARIQKGELWRAATALGLHADLAHLFGNLLFGALFCGLLARLMGSGLAGLACLSGGVLGNLANAFLRDPPHTVVGASTAVFSALALLALLSWHQGSGGFGLRRLAPLGGGMMLFVWLGFAGERTDIGAHVAGFVAGALLALPLARLPARLLADRRFQLGCGASALTLFVLAWSIALGTLGSAGMRP